MKPLEDAPDEHRRPPARSLASLLDELPAGEDDAVVHTEQAALTRGDLHTAIRGVAQALRESGVGAGTPIGALVSTGPAGLVCMMAAWEVGATYVPLNQRATTEEIHAALDETPLALVVGAPADLDAHDLPVGRVALDPTGWTATVQRVAVAEVTPLPTDTALVLRTSGTTGQPKAVMLSHEGIYESIDSSLRKLRRGQPHRPGPASGPPRVNLIPLSLAFWAGIFNTLFAFRAGFGVVLLEQATPEAIAGAIARHRITSTVLPPALISMLTDSAAVASLEPLRIVRSITAPLSPALARRFHDRFGVLVLNSYGQTELGGEVVGWTIDDIRTFGMDKLGAVGRPYPNVSVRIVDEALREVAPGEVGEIVIRSPYQMKGYASGERTDERVVDGHLRTGDLGRLDDDGFLWIEGRVSDVINRGGLKVFPDEVEEVLRRHVGVRDVAVAGVPDDRVGEVPKAWVIPAGRMPSAEDLAGWCRRHLAPYKVPVAFAAVAELPRSAVGKLLRRELADGSSDG